MSDLSSFVQLSYYFKVLENTRDSEHAVAVNTLGVLDPTTIRVSTSLLEKNGLHLAENVIERLSPLRLAAKFAEIPSKKLLAVYFRKKEGEERLLVGYKVSNEHTPLGYSQVIDLQADPKNHFRLVDHRNLIWFIEAGYNGQTIIKYEVK